MNTTDFENLKKKISDIEKQQIKLQTQRESIIGDWKKDFNIDTLEKAEEKLAELQEKKELLLTKQSKVENKLKEILEGF